MKKLSHEESAEVYFERIKSIFTKMAKEQGKEWTENQADEATHNFLGFMKVAVKIEARKISEARKLATNNEVSKG